MKIGEQYKCEHFKEKLLTVEKMYGPKLAGLRPEQSEVLVMASHDLRTEPHLMLAHIAKQHTMLVKQESTLW